jgi:stage II sporulation protein D
MLLLPSLLRAEDVRVRLRTAHPPASITIRSMEGTLRWRKCLTCAEQSGSRLTIVAPTNGTMIEGNSDPDYFVTGRYELNSNGAPGFYSQFPLHVRAKSGTLLIVVTMPLEEYVQHVLMAESGDFGNQESIKAMAIATRTYATRFAHQHKNEGFDFCDTTHCQVFHWKEANERMRNAVEATEGKTVGYHGAAASTYFHQNCGGTTAAANEAWAQVAEPYLTVHADPYCLVNGGLKWETSLTREQISRALRLSGIESPATWNHLEIRTRAKSRRARLLFLTGASGNLSLSASTLRFAVNRAFGWNNIRSDLYDVRDLGDKVLFSGHGAGHGVGLCQAGAEEMARQGKSFREILSFYYPGTEIREPAQENWEKRSDERLELLSTQPDMDSEIIPLAKRLLRETEANLGWKLPIQVRLQVYPSLDSYRNKTGQPGWVAASTRGRTIRLQPMAELRKHGVLESTLRHELIHLLVESRAPGNLPPWFREGLVLYLAGADGADIGSPVMPVGEINEILSKGGTQENSRQAYHSAQKIVADLVLKYGKQKVLGWLSIGLPGDIVASVGSRSAAAPGH